MQVVSSVSVVVTDFPEFDALREALAAAQIDLEMANDTAASIRVSARKPA